MTSVGLWRSSCSSAPNEAGRRERCLREVGTAGPATTGIRSASPWRVMAPIESQPRDRCRAGCPPG
jgi:hypothetical protein